MTPFSQFVPLVSLECPMVPRDLAIHAIREATVRFCELSMAWQAEQDPWDVSSTEREIEVNHPDSARVFKIMSATFDDEIVEPTTTKAMDELYPDWRTTETGTPEYVLMTGLDVAALIPHPDADGDLVVWACLKPSHDAIETEDFLYIDHREAIADGAKAYLMALTGKPWSNPMRALQLKELADSAARAQNVAKTTGHTRARLRTGFVNR